MNEQVKELLGIAPQKLGTIQTHLRLESRHEALEVMEALEVAGEVYCSVGIWRLVDKCCRCDEPISDRINGVAYCVSHLFRLKLEEAVKRIGGAA